MTELAARAVPRSLPRASTVAVVLLLAAAAAMYGRALAFDGEPLPGTRVAGVDVSGLERGAVVSAVQSAVLPLLAQPVAVQAGGRTVPVSPRDLFALDAEATADLALASGRGTEPRRVAALVGASTRDVAPVLVARPEAQRRFLSEVAHAGSVRPRSAAIEMRGLEPSVRESRDGRSLDARRLLADLRAAALGGKLTVDATFVVAHPRRSTAAAREAAAVARAIVTAPVYVLFDGRPLRELAPAELAGLVRFEPRGGHFVTSLDRAGLARLLGPSLAAHSRPPVDARFQIVGDRVRVAPARDGVGLDVGAALGEVTAAAYASERRIAEVRLAPVPPKVSTESLAALGITEKVSSFTTEMGPSSSNRIWNVHLMADYIDGTIVRPGRTFSFNRAVGPRTVERGFREGQMIVGSLLLPSIGGGVCQTATTLFNNAFELGLPIVARRNHSFYISHYPMGRDAAVSWGGPDFAFRNDLKNALLIKASYTDSTLTFTFYGTSEGRRVVARTGPQVNVRAPTPSYAYDPYAPAGSVRTVRGDRQSGFDVTVRRTVYAPNGKVLRRDAFTSKYIAVGDTTVYGPGTTPPGPYFVLPPPE